MVATPPMSRSERVAFAVCAVVSAMTRLIPLSKGPWDWDEVLFCFALGKYDVAAHHPHPLGFPLYVALGKVARLFADSDFHALQAVNVLAAMLVFPVAFWLARSFRLEFLPSLTGALIFAFLPNVWFYGGTAFSDVPAMVLFLAACAAYLSAGVSARRYAIATLLIAAAMLVRPQNAFLAIFPWTLATARMIQARKYAAVVACSIAGAVAVGAGYYAAASITGTERYVYAVEQHGKWVRAADTIHNPTRPGYADVLRMQLDPYEAGKVTLLINALALIGAVASRRRAVLEILLTFAPFFFFATVMVNPYGASRFSLSYMPAIVLLAAIGISVVANVVPRARLAVTALFCAAILGRLVTWTLPAFVAPRTTQSPPVQAALWVRDHVPVTSAVIVDHSIWPWAHYFIPNHRLIDVNSAEEVVRSAPAPDAWYIHMDPSQLANASVFRRPHSHTWNIVTKRAFEASVLPATSMAVFGKGWYGPEGEGHPFRWSGKSAEMELAPVRGRGELRLSFLVPVDAIGHPVDVRLSWNGTPVMTYVATKSLNELSVTVSSRSAGANRLRIEVSDTLLPRRGGPGADPRELGLMLRSWQWGTR